MQGDIAGKRLQLLRELIPNLSRIGLLVRATSQANDQYVEETEAAARALGMDSVGDRMPSAATRI